MVKYSKKTALFQKKRQIFEKLAKLEKDGIFTF